MALKGK